MITPAYREKRLRELVTTPRVYWADITPQNLPAGLLELVQRAQLEPQATVLEVGSYAGVSSEVFALHAANVLCVDQWLPYPEISLARLIDGERLFDEMVLRVRANGGNVVKFRMESGAAASYFASQVFDLVYIDGAHAHAAVSRDIQMWLPKVKPGGWIAGHDISIRSVERAVYENLGQYNRDGKNFFRFPDTSWLLHVGN